MQRKSILIGLLVGVLVGAGVVVAATTFTPSSGTIYLTTNSGTSVGVSGGPDITLSDPFINDSAVNITTKAGNMTVVGSGTARAVVAKQNIEGTWTNLSQLDVDQNAITVAPADKPSITVSGDAATLDFRGLTSADDGVVDFVYSGASGTTSLTLHTAPPSTQLAAVDQNDLVLDVATSTADGTITFNQLTNSKHSVELQTNDGGPTTSNLDPDGITSSQVDWTLEVDVDDPDFPEDQASVEFFVDGNSVGTDTLNNSGTASTTVSGLAEGDHSWYAEVTDAFGNSTTSKTATFTVEFRKPTISNITPNGSLSSEPSSVSATVNDTDFYYGGDEVEVNISVDNQQVLSQNITQKSTLSTSIPSSGLTGGQHTITVTATGKGGTEADTTTYSVPSTIRIFNETSPSQLITGSPGVEVEFFSQDTNEVFSETVPNGELNLSGYPVDQQFIITFSGSGYHDRRIVLDSIYEQQDVYLLPTNQPSVDVEFAFTDYTGQFPPSQTFLFVEAAITKDFDNDSQDETRFQTILGDTIGSTGTYPATLAANERYRLRIRNQPNTRLLGGYTATTSEIETIDIRGLTLEPPEEQRYATKRIVGTSGGQRYLTWKFRDEANATTSLDLTLSYRSNGTVVYQDTIIDDDGVSSYAVYQIPLANNTAYTWNWTGERNGRTIGAEAPVGRGQAPLGIPLDPTWLGTAAMVGIVFTAALAGSRKHTYIAMTVVALAGIMMFMSVIKIAVPLWWLAAVIAVGGHLKHAQTPGA
jgi:hypothetical protein